MSLFSQNAARFGLLALAVAGGRLGIPALAAPQPNVPTKADALLVGEAVGWQKLSVTGNPGNGWLPLTGRLESVGSSTDVEGHTGLTPGRGNGAQWKVSVGFGGGFASGGPVTIPTTLEMADRMSKNYQSWKPQVSSGSLKLGQFEGTFGSADSAIASTSGFGISYAWFYSASLVSRNARFSLSASVLVDADRPENNDSAQTRFEQLKLEAKSAMAALQIHLE